MNQGIRLWRERDIILMRNGQRGGRGEWDTLLEASHWTLRGNRNKYDIRFTFVTLHGMTPNLMGLNHLPCPLIGQGVLITININLANY